MMWLVIAALLLAAAIQSIGYYQKSAHVFNMKSEVDGVVSRIYAEAANEGSDINEATLTKVISDHNTAHGTDGIVISYNSVSTVAAGPSGDENYGFERASSLQTFYLKAKSDAVDDAYVVYFFKDTANFKQGISVVTENRIDPIASGEATPGVTTSPTETATATPSPSTSSSATPSPTETSIGETANNETPTPTPTPVATETTPTPTSTPRPTVEPAPFPSATPTPTVAPPNPSIKSTADIVAFDTAGSLWNYGQLITTDKGRVGVGNGDTSIPTSFFVTDWNGDGIQDLVLQKTNGQLELRTGLRNGGFSTSSIGDFGWAAYDITIGKWKKSDTLPSIIAIEKSTGDLYLYANTNGAAPTSRTKFNIGWAGLGINLLDYDRDGNMDIIAKFSNGDLRLYRTDGAGSLINESRPVINTGWNIMDSIRVISGAEGDGTRGIVARMASTGELYYYPINTSSWGASRKFNFGWNGYRIAGN
jgi:hypothetical protein